jgi:DNA-binding response OmpR family regulator
LLRDPEGSVPRPGHHRSDRLADLRLNDRRLSEIARRSRPDLRILFITGHAQNAAIRSGFLDQGMDMMTKAVAMEALATKIRDSLEALAQRLSSSFSTPRWSVWIR